jgi:hypothetical protein
MYGAQIRVFKQMYQERFCCFLQSQDGRALPSVILSSYWKLICTYLAHQSCKRELKKE